jgi:hypothetical protein
MFVALAGCHRDIRNEDAVRQGVMDYLSTRQGLNVSSMNVSVTSLVFRQDDVDATVVFTPKGSTAGTTPMSLHYTLEKKGDRWVVKPHSTSGQNPHGGGMGMPPASGNPGAMPPGHPVVPPQDSAPK